MAGTTADDSGSHADLLCRQRQLPCIIGELQVMQKQ